MTTATTKAVAKRLKVRQNKVSDEASRNYAMLSSLLVRGKKLQYNRRREDYKAWKTNEKRC